MAKSEKSVVVRLEVKNASRRELTATAVDREVLPLRAVHKPSTSSSAAEARDDQ